MDETKDYSTWSNEQLIARVTDLENRLKRQQEAFAQEKSIAASFSTPPQSARPSNKKFKEDKPFDSSRYSTRLIALKFAYLGQRYNGFEHHANNITPLPTIEEVMFRALMKTRLIFPSRQHELKDGEVDWTGCDYSKCGRTDRGVSAFGQVIGLRVRSKRPTRRPREPSSEDATDGPMDGEHDDQVEALPVEEEVAWDPVTDELPYIQLLNRVLPDDIRILAWCPDPGPEFSARFSCRERQYKYFFTQPAFAPTPGDRGIGRSVTGKPLRDGWLDIEAMQDAAKRYEGLNDFRNFCKIDPAKQISNYQRRIFHASVEKMDPTTSPAGYVGWPGFGPSDAATNGNSGDHAVIKPPAIYVFNVHGSAFLWHQVRHLVAVLFLVGQGLEPPSVVSDLLDVEKTPKRPMYEMALDAPLVLWDCRFPKDDDPDGKDALNWIYIGDEGARDLTKRAELDGSDGKFGRSGIMESLWATWRQRKIDEVLAGTLMDVAAAQGRQTSSQSSSMDPNARSVRLFDGDNIPRPVGKYVPILKKKRLEHFEVLNARYAEKRKAQGRPLPQSLDVDD